MSTFLRRAERVRLDVVSIEAVQASLRQTITEHGRTINEEDLRRAAVATRGYPYLIQLVGYHIWRQSTSTHIPDWAASLGIDAAKIRLGSLVHETGLHDLSGVDRTFLLAMAQDEGASSVGDIATRMGRESNYISVYRERLITAGMIRAAGYGMVEFAMPYLRDYLREHVAHLHAIDTPKHAAFESPQQLPSRRSMEVSEEGRTSPVRVSGPVGDGGGDASSHSPPSESPPEGTG